MGSCAHMGGLAAGAGAEGDAEDLLRDRVMKSRKVIQRSIQLPLKVLQKIVIFVSIMVQ